VTAHVEILVENVDQRLAVPVQAIYTKGPQRYVFRASLTGASYAPIELGAIGTEWAEVRSGLQPGERIRLAFSDEDKRAIPDPTRDGNGVPIRPGGAKPDGARLTGGPPASGAPAAAPAAAPAGRPERRGGPNAGRKP